MPKITRQRTGELVRKLFEILMTQPDGMRAAVALEKLASSVTLSDYEAGVYESSGSRRFEKIVRFATVDCVKAGWLLKQKGTWLITEAGHRAYGEFKDPAGFYREAVRLYREWKASDVERQKPATLDTADDADEVEESSAITYEQAEEQAWREIERHLRTMNPYDFQQMVADLLKAMSYHVSWVSPPGKDGGIDIIAFTDPLGTKAPRI